VQTRAAGAAIGASMFASADITPGMLSQPSVLSLNQTPSARLLVAPSALRSGFVLMAAVSFAVALSGCLTNGAGEEIRADIRAQEERLVSLEQGSVQSREEIDAKVKELEQVLERATQVVTRNSADAGAQVEQMREELAKLQGVVDELKYKLEAFSTEQAQYKVDLEGRIAAGSTKPGGVKPVLDPSEIPADPEGHYKAGQAAYTANQHEKARALFREFLVRYPSDAKAGNAQYWIGASYLQENKPAAALGELRKVISDHAKSTAVNVALFGMADAFFRLKACPDAANAADALIKRKPDKALLDRIKKLAADIKKAPKGSCQ
jgi:TolA-binding protein